MRWSSFVGGVLVAAVLATASCGGGSDERTRSRTTRPPKPDIRGVDFHNYPYSLSCGEPNQTITVRDGVWEDPRGESYGAVRGVVVQYGDVTGDGAEDAVVEIACTFGAGSALSNVLVYSVEDGSTTKVGQLEGLKPSLDGAGQIVIWNTRSQPNEPRCCPSQFERAVYQYDGRIFVLTETTVHDAAEFEAVPWTTGE